MDKTRANSAFRATRRAFLGQTLAASTALVAGSTLIASTASAADLPVLREDDPVAVALGYKADATQVDVTQYPKRAGEGARQVCANCTLYQAKSDGMGLCSAIPGKLVAGAGWCNAWVGNI